MNDITILTDDYVLTDDAMTLLGETETREVAASEAIKDEATRKDFAEMLRFISVARLA